MKRPTSPISKIVCLFMLVSIASCNQEPKQEQIKVLAPDQIVTIPQAKTMYDTYGKRRVPLIQHYEDSINRQNNDNKEFDVGRFVYYDYKTIKQYLEFIEQEASDAGVEISTLRFYFSNYPDEANFPNSKEAIKHPRQNSIMLSPTYNDGKRDYLFYIGDGAEGKQAIPLNDSFDNVKGLSSSLSKDTKAFASFAPNLNTTNTNTAVLEASQSLTLNRGTGVPPPKNQ